MTLSEIGDSEAEATPPGSPAEMAKERRRRREGASKRRHTEGDVDSGAGGMEEGRLPLTEAKNTTTNTEKKKEKKQKERRAKTVVDESAPLDLGTCTPPRATSTEKEKQMHPHDDQPREDVEGADPSVPYATPPSDVPDKPVPIPIASETVVQTTTPSSHSPLRLGKNMLRVGLSRRSRVEPLHAYLKK